MNVSFHKDPYRLPNIGKLINECSDYQILSFMDGYFGYNQIKMDPMDTPKKNHVQPFYYYNFMPFRLSNANSTYQRLMDIMFTKLIGKNLEV